MDILRHIYIVTPNISCLAWFVSELIERYLKCGGPLQVAFFNIMAQCRYSILQSEASCRVLCLNYLKNIITKTLCERSFVLGYLSSIFLFPPRTHQKSRSPSLISSIPNVGSTLQSVCVMIFFRQLSYKISLHKHSCIREHLSCED